MRAERRSLVKERGRDAKLEKKKDELLVGFIAAIENEVRMMGPSALAFDALPFFDINKNYNVKFICSYVNRII